MRRWKRFAWVMLGLHVVAGVIAWHENERLATKLLVGVSPVGRGPVAPPPDVRLSLTVERADASIRAWLLEPAPGRVRGTIAILHGIHDSKLSSLDSARKHVQRGYRVLIWDSRGHGESSGEYLTYGVEEARDMLALIDQLQARELLARPLYVIGSSYGAATAVQYAALDPRVEKVAAIAPFASMREVVPAYLRWILGSAARLIPAPLVNARIDAAGRTAGFDPDLACPRCVAPNVHATALIVASRDDERIPYQQAQAVHAALGERARWLLVSGVGHVSVGLAPGVAEQLAQWLDE